ncbi:hypothetical protein ACFXTI_012963 [Malus domestica]
MLIKKKSKAFSTAYEGPPAAERFVIDLTSSNGKKDEAAKSEPVMPDMPKIANMIVDRITRRRGSVVPPVPMYVPRCSLRAKSGSSLERLITMKRDKVDSFAKMAPMPTLLTTGTDSPAEKG